MRYEIWSWVRLEYTKEKKRNTGALLNRPEYFSSCLKSTFGLQGLARIAADINRLPARHHLVYYLDSESLKLPWVFSAVPSGPVIVAFFPLRSFGGLLALSRDTIQPRPAELSPAPSWVQFHPVL